MAVSDRQSQPQTVEPLPLAAGELLSPDEIGSVLARLPVLLSDSIEQTTFNVPSEVLPPPRTGNKINGSFPPLETEPTPGAVEAGQLRILRFAPEGGISNCAVCQRHI